MTELTFLLYVKVDAILVLVQSTEHLVLRVVTRQHTIGPGYLALVAHLGEHEVDGGAVDDYFSLVKLLFDFLILVGNEPAD